MLLRYYLEARSSYVSASRGEYKHPPVLEMSLKNETIISEITTTGGRGGGGGFAMCMSFCNKGPVVK